MKQIDLSRSEYRAKGERPIHGIFLKSATMCGLWFAGIVLVARHVEHGLPWWVIAGVAIAPALNTAYIALALDH